MPYLQTTDEGVVIALFVQPRASKNQLVGSLDHELKVRLTSPPVDGAANALCIKFFAKLLGVAKSEIDLVAGEKSRHKRLLVRDVRLDVVRSALEAYL
ncbi:MAG TPA: DUF167 family protein [Geothermobacteraceae bacterium]|nr:DUF167 family protein [Geothermobacteraceae bacterium]